VRGQTPKVPPQEKKKKPTGRAMKRIKYNRRFVNVGACLGSIGWGMPKLGTWEPEDQLPLLLLLCMWLQF
jgi:ribosomal protein S30